MEDEFEELRSKAHQDRLIADLAVLTGESADQVVLKALEERMARLTRPASPAERKQRLLNILDRSLWSHMRGRSRPALTRNEEAEILGYGPEGV